MMHLIKKILIVSMGMLSFAVFASQKPNVKTSNRAHRKLRRALNSMTGKIEALTQKLQRENQSKDNEATATQDTFASIGQHVAAGQGMLDAARKSFGTNFGVTRIETEIALSDEMVKATFEPVVQAVVQHAHQDELTQKINQALEILNIDHRKIDWINKAYPAWAGGLLHLAVKEANAPAIIVLAGQPKIKVRGKNQAGRSPLAFAQAMLKSKIFTVSKTNPLYGKNNAVESQLQQAILLLSRCEALHTKAEEQSASQSAAQAAAQVAQPVISSASNDTQQDLAKALDVAVQPYLAQLTESLIVKTAETLKKQETERDQQVVSNKDLEEAQKKHETDLKLRQAQVTMDEIEKQKQREQQGQAEKELQAAKKLEEEKLAKIEADKKALAAKEEDKAKQAEIERRFAKEREEREKEQNEARKQLQEKQEQQEREEQERLALNRALKEPREDKRKAKHNKKKHSHVKAQPVQAPKAAQPEAAEEPKKSKKDKRREEREAEINGLNRVYDYVAQHGLRQQERREEAAKIERKQELEARKQEQEARDRMERLINNSLLPWLAVQWEKRNLSFAQNSVQVAAENARVQPMHDANVLACIARSAALAAIDNVSMDSKDKQ